MIVALNAVYLGYAAGALTVLALVPQVVRAYRTRRVDDLSLRMAVLLVLSGILWLACGVLVSQRPVVLTNAGVVILASALVIAKLRFR